MTFNETTDYCPKWSKAGVMRLLVDLEHCKDAPRPIDVVRPTPWHSSGSTYGADAIRISGSPAFINAVLARLTDMLEGENQLCRLAISRATVKNTEINGTSKQFGFAGNEVVYIQVHERNPEGIGSDAVPGATERWIEARPELQQQLERGKAAFDAMIGLNTTPQALRDAKRIEARYGLA